MIKNILDLLIDKIVHEIREDSTKNGAGDTIWNGCEHRNEPVNDNSHLHQLIRKCLIDKVK